MFHFSKTKLKANCAAYSPMVEAQKTRKIYEINIIIKSNLTKLKSGRHNAPLPAPVGILSQADGWNPTASDTQGDREVLGGIKVLGIQANNRVNNGLASIRWPETRLKNYANVAPCFLDAWIRNNCHIKIYSKTKSVSLIWSSSAPSWAKMLLYKPIFGLTK